MSSNTVVVEDFWMSRSDYTDDAENGWSLICWRGAVKSAIRGRRGQVFLREMLTVLDNLPNKRLIAKDLANEGEVCALGAVALARGIDVSEIEPEDHDTGSNALGIANAM